MAKQDDGRKFKPRGENSSSERNRAERGDKPRSSDRREPSNSRPNYDDKPRGGGDRRGGSDSRGSYGDKPRGGGDRRGGSDSRGSYGDKPRGGGDRRGGSDSRGSYGDKPRGGGDRRGGSDSRGSYGDKPRGGGDRRGGSDSGGSYGDKPRGGGDRRGGSDSRGSYGDKPRGDGDRRGGSDSRGSYGDKPRGGGDRRGGSDSRGSYGDKPRGDGDRRGVSDSRGSYGDKPRGGGDRRGGSDSRGSYGDKPRGDGDRRGGSDSRGSYGDKPRGGGDRRGGSDSRGSYGDKPRGGGDRRGGSDSRGSYGDKRKPYQRSAETPDYDFKKGRERTERSSRGDVAEEPEVKKDIRLNRFVANAGVCSRREADNLIQAGEIKVNGEAVSEMGYKVKPEDVVFYKGKELSREKLVYVLLNKPKDFITTTDDPQDRKTVMQLVAHACEERIYPVGRLDRDTTGLLLFTNDGELADKLMHPSNEVSKIYQVKLDRPIEEEHFNTIGEGFDLEDGQIKPDRLSLVESNGEHKVEIKIHSGKNRIVRRIFEHFGYEVVGLDRVHFAGLTKKGITRSKWRFLKDVEVARLKFFKLG